MSKKTKKEKKETENRIITYTPKGGNEITLWHLNIGHCEECKNDVIVKTVEFDKRNMSVIFLCGHIKVIDIGSVIKELVNENTKSRNK